MIRNRVLAVLAVAGLAGVASAQYSVNLGTLNVTSTPTPLSLDGSLIPAGTYTSYSVSFDWTAGGGNPWSNEAIWALTSTSDLGTAVFHADPGASADAANNANPVTLTWNGFMGTQSVNVETGFTTDGAAYNGGDDLFFFSLQTFGGSNATWSNVNVSLGFDAPPPPTGTFTEAWASGTTATGNTWTRPNAAGTALSTATPQFDVIPFGVTESGTYDIASITPDHDGFLHIYTGAFDSTDPLANFLAGNDDGPILGLGSSVTAGLELVAGEIYFAVISAFGTAQAGAYTMNALGPGAAFVIPAPGSLALLGLGGLAMARRRR